MGIEVELSVPVSNMLLPPLATAVDRVRNFLRGGVGHGTPVRALANGYRTVVDHDDMSAVVDRVRSLARPAIPDPHVRVGNLEYVSLPFDEGIDSTPAAGNIGGGLAEFEATVNLIAASMATTLANARTGIAPVPGTSLFIGLPPPVDWNQFAQSTGMTARFGLDAHAAILRKMSNLGQLQITAGIRPESIALHLNRAEHVEFIRPWPQVNVGNVLTSGAITTAATLLRNTPGLSHAQRASAALHGYLSLVAQYAYGHFVYRGDGTTVHKNMVGFLSKYPLNLVQDELDMDVSPRHWPPQLRADLCNGMIALVRARVRQADIAPRWRNPAMAADGEYDGPLGSWDNWVTNVMSGRQDTFSVRQIVTGVLNPTDHRNSPLLVHPSPSRPPTRPAPARAGVIPLEFRHIGGFSAAALWGVVERAISHVRVVNA
jgi:hypothetical protein